MRGAVMGAWRRRRGIVAAPVIAVPVLVAVMLDSRANGGAGGQRTYADSGRSARRYRAVAIAVRRAGRHERQSQTRQGKEPE